MCWDGEASHFCREAGLQESVQGQKHFSWSMISIWSIWMWECPPSHLGWHMTYVPPDSPSYIGCPGVINSLPFHSQKYSDGMINYMTTLPLRKEKKMFLAWKKRFVGKGSVPKMFYLFSQIIISLRFSFSWQTWDILVRGNTTFSYSGVSIKTREVFLKPNLMDLGILRWFSVYWAPYGNLDNFIFHLMLF